MNLFSWLFGSRKKPVPDSPVVQSEPKHVVEIAGTFLCIDAIGWGGLFAKSPNRKWAVSWRDRSPDGSLGGSRESGEGEYVLVNLSTGAVVARGSLPRPNQGHIADNGTFTLEDWHFGSSLSGTFRAFSSDGRTLLSRTFTANILESGLSKNGKLAYCMTANSPTEDANKLRVYDVEAGQELYAIKPRRFGADRIEFDEKHRQLVFTVSGGGEYRYGADGTILDDHSADDAFLKSTDYSAVIMTAETMLKGDSFLLAPGKVEEILAELIRARHLGADQNPAWKPTALKVQGMAHEALAQIIEAIACYQEALELNPKIGVKRKLDSLRKRVGTGPANR